MHVVRVIYNWWSISVIREDDDTVPSERTIGNNLRKLWRNTGCFTRLLREFRNDCDFVAYLKDYLILKFVKFDLRKKG